MTKEQALEKLNKSSFRSRFKLGKADIDYINEKGMDTIRSHAKDFVKKKLETKLANDGKQTPMTGHPVFKAMHGCACCCRDCLNKWYNVPLDTKLTENQQERIVGLLMYWIEDQMSNRITINKPKSNRRLVYPIKPDCRYRYYDPLKNVDSSVFVKKVANGIVHIVTEDGRPFKANLSDVRYKLFNSMGYDIEGFDIYGYDATGYNRDGINRNGISREGLDRNGNQVGAGSAYEASCYAGKETTEQFFRNKKRK